MCGLAWLALAAIAAPAQDPPAVERVEWSPGLSTAFEAYDAGRYADTVEQCRQIHAGARDARLAADAQALSALALLRMPSRQDRLTGRAMLANLTQSEPALLERPACRLAYGIAQRELAESADAILHLTMAREGFRRRGDRVRAAGAAVELAHAWTLHADWQTPIPGYPAARPETPEAADALRAARVRDVYDALPDDPAFDRWRLEVDRYLLELELRTDPALPSADARLQALAAARPMTGAVAWALLTLAEQCEARRDWERAERYFARAVESPAEADAARARRGLEHLRLPALSLEGPAWAPPGAAAPARVVARNVAPVRVEVRRVDLAAWLEARRGDAAPALLPESGALVFEASCEPPIGGSPRAWEHTLEPPDGLESGAYVLIARATAGDQPLLAKKLLLVNRTALFGVADASSIVLWLCTPDGGRPPHELRGTLRVVGAPATRELVFRDGVALTPLPPEARALRGGRWLCEVRVDGETLVVDGALPSRDVLDTPPGVLLLCSNPSPTPGETVRVVGVLRRPSVEALRTPVSVELRNLEDRVVATQLARVDPAGVFVAAFEIDDALAGAKLAVIARLGERVLESTPGQVPLHPADDVTAPVDVDLRLTREPGAPRDSVAGRVTARYRWGVPLAGADLTNRYRVSRLPDAPPADALYTGLPFHDERPLDADGFAPFVTDLAHRNMPPGPLAVGVWSDVKGWDGRITTAFAAALHAQQSTQVWISAPDGLALGDAAPLAVGWFDPQRLAESAPRLFIREPDGTRLRLPTRPSPVGALADEWRPRTAGPHTLEAELPLRDGSVHATAKRVGVAAAGESVGIRIASAQIDPALDAVVVRLTADQAAPCLVIAEQETLMAAQAVAPFVGSTELRLPLNADGAARPTIHVLGVRDGGPVVLGAAPAQLEPQGAFDLKLVAPGGPLTPGTTAPVVLNADRRTANRAPAAYVARLIRADSDGSLNWTSGSAASAHTQPRRRFSWLSPGLNTPGAAEAHTIESGTLSADLTTALFLETTLWAQTGLIRPQVPLSVPVPPRAGRYRLIVTTFNHATHLATATCELDVRADLEISLECPAQFELGDRLPLVARLENTTDRTISGSLEFEPGRALAYVPTDGARGAIPIDVPPRSTRFVPLRVEAAHAGRGAARITVATEQRRSAAATYRVHEAGGVAAQAALRVVRRVYRVAPEIAADPEVRETLLDAPRIPVAAGEALALGTLVLVEDQITVESPLDGVEWVQAAPANCHTVSGSARDLPAVVPLERLALHEATFAGDVTAAGTCRHLSAFVTVRPGACFIPVPRVTLAGAPVAASLAAETPLRIQVD